MLNDWESGDFWIYNTDPHHPDCLIPLQRPPLHLPSVALRLVPATFAWYAKRGIGSDQTARLNPAELEKKQQMKHTLKFPKAVKDV